MTFLHYQNKFLATLNLDFATGCKKMKMTSTGFDSVAQHPPGGLGPTKITLQEQVLRETGQSCHNKGSRTLL